MTTSNFNNVNLGQQGAFDSLTTPVIADGAVTAKKIGTLASAVIQDITYTAATGGTAGNSISITYVESVIPGHETIEVSGSAITVNIGNSTFSIVEIVDATHFQVSSTEGIQVGDSIVQGLNSTTVSSIVGVSELQVASTSGFVIGNATDSGLLSTAAQVLTVIQNSYLASVLVTALITGTSSNKQVGVSTTNLSGGIVSAVVSSIHSDSNPNLTGAVQFASGTHVTLSQVGQTITVNATGELSQTLTDNHIFVGNASNIATDVPMSGDATIVASGALTLAIVNSNVGSFTNASITVDAKGRITAAANGNASANTTLSNLTSPTALNQDLLPPSDGGRSLGSSSLQFNQIFTYSVLSINDNLDLLSDFSVFLRSGPSSDIILDARSGNINASTHSVTNMADPVNPQDAATKNYVDTHETTPAGTTGAVQFNNSGVFGADNSNFFWDSTNHRLGVGTSTPSFTLDVNGHTNLQGDFDVFGISNIHNTLQVTGGILGNSNITAEGSLYGLDIFEISTNPGVNPAALYANAASTQVGINTTSPDSSAILDITSTTRGFLPPRMTTTQRTSISSPAEGLIVYDTTLFQLWEYQNGAWAQVGGGSSTPNVVQTFNTSAFNAPSSMTQSGTTATITPSSASSTVKITISGGCSSTAGNNIHVDIYRNNSVSMASTYLGQNSLIMFSDASSNLSATGNYIIIDSPATTSATIYTVWASSSDGGGYWSSNGSTITLEEIV